MVGHRPLPVNRMTHKCKNITFPKLLPPGQRPPWAETPGQKHPWTETLLDRDPLDKDPPGQRSPGHVTCDTCWDIDPHGPREQNDTQGDSY